MFNGRVNLGDRKGVSGADKLPGFDYRVKVAASESMDAIRGNLQATPLNQTFFSPANVQILQNRLRREVYERSKGDFLIDEQSADELLTIMRAMYLQYGKNQPSNIRGQIEELNKIVADWAVPRILSECSMHKTYLHDIQHMPVPLSQPILETRTGSKSAAFDRFF
jgi:hypothetical protein